MKQSKITYQSLTLKFYKVTSNALKYMKLHGETKQYYLIKKVGTLREFGSERVLWPIYIEICRKGLLMK